MEGLIILFVIISAIQKIAEKLQEARKEKNPEKVQTWSPHPYTQSSKNEEVPTDPLDIFREWEQIFFPKDNETVAKDTVEMYDEMHEESYEDSYEERYEDSYEESYEKPHVAKQPAIIQTQSASNGMHSQSTGMHREVFSQRESKLQVDQRAIRQGVLWSEILAAPKSSLHWRKYQRSSTRG